MPRVTPNELAERFHTEPRVVRKFLRSKTPIEKHPGRGHRWELNVNKQSLSRLDKQFTEWSAAHTRSVRGK